MLYRANNNTKQICLNIRRNMFNECCDDVALHIYPLVCETLPEYSYEYSPCGGLERVEKKREPSLTLVYDMFDRNEQGGICFLLDSQFQSLACGRYNAKLMVCGCEVFKFQIDKREVVQVSQVTMNNQSDCCEGRNGC